MGWVPKSSVAQEATPRPLNVKAVLPGGVQHLLARDPQPHPRTLDRASARRNPGKLHEAPGVFGVGAVALLPQQCKRGMLVDEIQQERLSDTVETVPSVSRVDDAPRSSLPCGGNVEALDYCAHGAFATVVGVHDLAADPGYRFHAKKGLHTPSQMRSAAALDRRQRAARTPTHTPNDPTAFGIREPATPNSPNAAPD